NTAGIGPTYLVGENLRSNQQSVFGVLNGVSSGAGTVFQSNATGTGVQNFNLGLEPYASGLNSSPFNVVPGGDGIPIYASTNLRAPVARKVAMPAMTFALTDSINLTADASYGNVETVNITAPVASNFVGISGLNPYAAPIFSAAGIPTDATGFALVN